MTRRFTIFLLVPFLASLAFLTGCSGSKQGTKAISSDVAAVIGEDILTVNQVMQAFRKYAEKDSTDEGLARYLEQYVNYRVKVKEARNLGYDQDSVFVQELRDYKTNLGRDYIIEKDILRPLAEEWFQRSSKQVFVSHILIRVSPIATPEDTLAAYNRIVALRDSVLSGKDFNDMAEKYSDDESARVNRGVISVPVTAGRYIYAFENLAYNTPVGEVSRISRSKRYGYHLLKVEKVAPNPPAIRLSQIFVTPKGTTSEDSTEALTRIQSYYDQAVEGADFEELSAQYSDNDQVKQSRGDFGQFVEAGTLLPELDSRAFALGEIGEITEPFWSNFGLHILKLTDRIDESSFEDVYDEIKERIVSPPQAAEPLERYQYKRELLIDSLRALVTIERNDSILEQAMMAFPEDSLLTVMAPAGSFTRQFGNQIWATVDDTPVLLSEIAARSIRRRPTPFYTPYKIAREEASKLLDEAVVTAYAQSLDKHDRRFAQLMSEYEDGILMFSYSQDAIWNTASEDTAGVRAYFESNKSNYRYGRRLEATAFTSNSDSLLSLVKVDLNAGGALDTLKEKWTGVEGVRVETVMLTDSTGTAFDRAFDLSPGSYTEYPQYQSGNTVLVSGGWHPARQKQFREARAEVVSDFQKVVEERLLESLRRKYNVRTYPEHLTER